MLNKVEIQGRFTKDPELRYTSTKKPCCSFTVACERDFKSGSGEKGTDYIDCVAWENKAEFISSHFNRGEMVVVTGRLQKRSWTDNSGQRRSVAEIVVESAYFCGSKKSDGGFVEVDDDDELPF